MLVARSEPAANRVPELIPMRAALLVTALGCGAMIFEGYDLVVYGSAVPSLLAMPGWGLTPARVGAIGGAALLGMFFGAPAAGWMSDRFGRRKLYIGLLSFFSCMMILVAVAPTPGFLAFFRFLAGLGFGGVPPICIAMVTEFAPARRRVLFNGFMLAGFGIGGILAAGLSLALIGHIGFRGLFALGAFPLVSLVPLAAWLLPESPNFRRRSAVGHMPPVRESPWVGVLRGRAAVATTLFAIANFCALLLSFALITWLPQIMRGAGFALGSSLQFLLLLNLGGTVGALFGATLADRMGGRGVATGMFFVAALSLAALAIPAPVIVIRLLVLIAGAAALGNQTVVFGYMATHYSPESRATAIGAASGVGRLGAAVGPLIGGILVGAGFALSGDVFFFATVAFLAGIATVLVPPILRSMDGNSSPGGGLTEGELLPENLA